MNMMRLTECKLYRQKGNAKHMTDKISTGQFLNRLDREWNLTINERRLIANILRYVKSQFLDDDESAQIADALIDNVHNISLQELETIDFSKD